MSRRELILQELGLWPAWVPRERAGAPAGAAPEAVPDDAPASRAERVARMDWPALKEAVRTCAICPLHAARKQAVFGVGDEQADWLFVGEGPGAEEDARGEPFVGQAGRLLDAMLAAIGLQRGRDVYIANIVKCRPPGNRVPAPPEAAACEPFLLRQIALIRPRLVVALGKTAANNLLRNDASIASVRGRLHDLGGTPLLVTYHPAYLLRTLADKSKAWEDLCLAREVMQRLKAGEPAPT